MKKYETIIFDFDGTLAYTSPGILNCHRYAHRMMGRAEPPEAVLRGVIGGPLLSTYQTVFKFSQADARQAVAHYRQRYADQGLCEALLYPGIEALLHSLKDNGRKIGLATLKSERFLEIMLENMGIRECFDAIYGMDDCDRRTKAALIELCMCEVRAVPESTVLIGDSLHDRDGARCAGVSFLGVTYGFGLGKGTSPLQAGAVAIADSCAQLSDLLL